MKSLVVFFAVVAVACGSYVPLAQPPHHPAVVLDPHGRPLDTAEVIGARALHLQAKALEHHAPLLAHAYAAPIAHSYAAPITHGYAAPIAHAAVVAAPAAVSHQSRVDVHSSPALFAHAPVYGAHALLGHGHLLKKRSLAHIAYAAPVIAPAAISHQSRVDVHSSPAIVSHAVAAPVLAHAYAAPVVAHAYAPAAVSHQSRIDYHSSPAIIGHSVYAAPNGNSFYGHGLSHAHLLKKRSLAHVYAPVAHASAVSHQSRVDVISSPALVSHPVAAPIVAAPVYAHAVPAAVSHQSRVDIRTSAAHVPVTHSAVYTAPVSHWGSFLHALHL